MQINNIENLLIFREDPGGHVLTLDELATRYGYKPAGTNFYYGINQQNVDATQNQATALNATDRDYLNKILISLIQSNDVETTLVLGLEPPDVGDSFTFVLDNLDLMRRLANDLDSLQKQARSANKRLNIHIRYGSEMNSGDQHYGLQPENFKASFIRVRLIFSQIAPGVLFSFSPALRADRDEALITNYWPGSQYVDIIGGTWYIHGPGQRDAAIAMMTTYFVHRINTGKPFALSEVGGGDANYKNNDAVLQDMLHEIETLRNRGISLLYATLFLEDPWGSDSTLGFLSNS